MMQEKDDDDTVTLDNTINRQNVEGAAVTMMEGEYDDDV